MFSFADRFGFWWISPQVLASSQAKYLSEYLDNTKGDLLTCECGAGAQDLVDLSLNGDQGLESSLWHS